MGKKSGIRETDEKRAGCGILAKKGQKCGIRTPPSRPSPFHYVSKIQTNLSLIYNILNTNEQCCQLSRIIQETPEFGPYLLENRPSLPFLQKTQLFDNNEISNILHCLSYFSVNIKHSKHSNMPLSYKQ